MIPPKGTQSHIATIYTSSWLDMKASHTNRDILMGCALHKRSGGKGGPMASNGVFFIFRMQSNEMAVSNKRVQVKPKSTRTYYVKKI